LPKYTCTSTTAAYDAAPIWFFVILNLFFFDVLSLLHPLTTMLFFMQDFGNPPVGPATGWSHVAVHNTNPVGLCKNGEGTGKERKHPIQRFVKSFGISILHSAARDFHLGGLGAIRTPVEPSRSPAIQVSSSTQVEQVALCPSYR
jgi:hypothetical protein